HRLIRRWSAAPERLLDNEPYLTDNALLDEVLGVPNGREEPIRGPIKKLDTRSTARIRHSLCVQEIGCHRLLAHYVHTVSGTALRDLPMRSHGGKNASDVGPRFGQKLLDA